ncbi:MAG: hypothetical protein MR555_06050 [Spirochaetia bacterium]|nr:hypothetical protein [Spirochaetia bacterium]MDY3887514.1 ATPase domain-containing protein [Treponema sp.]
MVKQDLISHSPVRFFENAADGGLKDGQMGLITSKKGLGKTSILVQFAIDSLLNDKHVVHISFDQHSSNVIAWYDSVLAEIGKKKNFGDISVLSDTIVSERTILNTNQESFSMPKIVSTIKALKEGGINVSAVVIDDVDMVKLSAEDLKIIADYISQEKMTAWFSFTNESPKLSESTDAAKLSMFATVCHIASNGKNLELSVLKSDNKEVSGVAIKLDSKTLLMTK